MTSYPWWNIKWYTQNDTKNFKSKPRRIKKFIHFRANLIYFKSFYLFFFYYRVSTYDVRFLRLRSLSSF